MTLFSILDTLLIGPLKLVFEIIYALSIKFIEHPGYTIIVFSFIMNILVLPLYRRADAMQELARDVEARLHDGVAHIKKTFTGDERMMILQTYYRQNNYKPTDALKGSVSLLLEIPFFMAAYQFLSNLDYLIGASLGPITDLSQPDGLLVIGSLTLNLLPILMTLINVISSAIYLKGFPLKTKVQLYGMALFFLVFLYNSPSGLVFYWTLNNLFSLVKTIFYKLKNPGKIIAVFSSLAGIALPVLAMTVLTMGSTIRNVFIFCLALVLQLPLIFPFVKKRFPQLFKPITAAPNKRMFLWGSLFLTILTGFLIPSTFIAASPEEFVYPSYFYHPLWYIVSSGCMAAGFFLIWLRVFYGLASNKAKVFFDHAVWIFCGVALVNYMFFGWNLGLVSPALQYEFGVWFSKSYELKNILVLAIVTLIMYIVSRRWNRAAVALLLTATLALGGMSILNVATIAKTIDRDSSSDPSNMPYFRLSKTGQNVVVIMLDRAMGEFVPYIMNERPELEEKFDGFTFYSNTISHGGHTNFGSPGLYGGYEYTPVEMNRRSEERLVDKQNEALKVLPVLFSENDYEVTVFDPVYANYNWTPDLSIFNEYPEISAYNTIGKYTDDVQRKMIVENNTRNFFVFSVMKVMPAFAQHVIYNNGIYLHIAQNATENNFYWVQSVSSASSSTGILYSFMDSYNVLLNLPNICRPTEEDTDTFLIMSNNITHEPMLLQAPDYTPSWVVDNREYDTANAERFIHEDRKLITDGSYQMMHYHTNISALIQLGEWFDYLRENDVYDNTRIILVSDHGQILSSIKELIMGDDSPNTMDVELYYPLLMVKDFNSSGFTTSSEFMTNADVPTLAVQDIIDDPINPFTGKEINDHEKTAHEQFITMSMVQFTSENNGNTFLPSRWASVKDDLWNPDNWTFYEGEHVLSEHKAP